MARCETCGHDPDDDDALRALAVAKGAELEAMQTLVGLMQQSEDDRVRAGAADRVLKYAGVREPEPVAVTSPERLIEAMTPEELTIFVETKEWPDRFKPQLARLALHLLGPPARHPARKSLTGAPGSD